MVPIHIEMIEVAPPHSAAVVKISHFPVAADDGAKLHAFLTALLRIAGAGLNLEVLFQNEYFAKGRDLVNPHLPEWRPEVGLGVWPNRPPPELWKKSDMFRMARGERVPLMYQVSWIAAGPKAASRALDLLLGRGMIVAIFHAGPASELMADYKQTFLPAIQVPNLRILPFYVPLLDLQSLHQAQPGDLRCWLGKARFYLRESPQDNAILLIADTDLNVILERSSARRDGPHSWLVF